MICNTKIQENSSLIKPMSNIEIQIFALHEIENRIYFHSVFITYVSQKGI